MKDLTDSIASPFTPRLCHEWQAPSSLHEKQITITGRVPYTLGIAPEERTMLPGYDSGVLCLIIGVFLLLAYNFRHYSTFLKNFSHDLWSVRHTDNTFTVRTATETGIQMSIVLLACLCEGIVINSVLTAGGVGTPFSTFIEIAVLTLLAVLYYLWQLAVYRLMGYVFADRLSARQWLKGFNASQALLGMSLAVPALVVLFNPACWHVVAVIAIACYLVARLIFIFKGFRLFYDNYGSLLYFILYLCALEIVPLVVIFRVIVAITELQI